jgi:Transposase
VAAGERVIRVAPKRMGESRRGERRPGKSDQIDALAVARAVLRDGVERFPVAFLDERAMEIRLLADHREDVVAERTRAQNRLRWHLVELCPELEASLPKRSLDRQVQLDRVARALRRLPAGARVRVARELVTRIRALTREANALEAELCALVRVHRPGLLAETGCGALTAATLIGRTAGAQRFATDALRAPDRHGPDPRLLGQPHAPPPAPRRRPPAQPRPAHDRDHARPPRPRHARLPRAQDRRGQDPQGGHPLPQATPRPPLLPPPHRTAAHHRPANDRRQRTVTNALLDIDGMCRPGSVLARV